MATVDSRITKSDPDIFVDVRTALNRDPQVPAAIHVHVAHSVVRLTGSVRLPSERAAAELAVRDIAGVRHVVNTIVVTEPVSAEGLERPDLRW